MIRGGLLLQHNLHYPIARIVRDCIACQSRRLAMPSSQSGRSRLDVPAHDPTTVGPLRPPKREASDTPLRPERIAIHVSDPLDHAVPSILHKATQHEGTNPDACAILVSGAGGGVTGPMAMWVSLATRLARDAHVHALRLDYRDPAVQQHCVPDVEAAISFMTERFGVKHFVLAGWSFGGAPVFTVAARRKSVVRGVATVASQTAQTEGIRNLAPMPVLLLHGTADTTVSPWCSERLSQMYNNRKGSTGKGDCEVVMYERDDHALSHHAAEAEDRIYNFFGKALVKAGAHVNVVDWRESGSLLGGAAERVAVMKKGHDLENERL